MEKNKNHYKKIKINKRKKKKKQLRTAYGTREIQNRDQLEIPNKTKPG